MTGDEDHTLSEQFGGFLSRLRLQDIPDGAIAIATRDLIDAAGLCLAARRQAYMSQLVAGWDSEGDCTALGHERGFDTSGAALVNGVAIHGEDFDDTLEGAPIRVGAMVIPAVLAASERHGLSGERALIGIIAGLEAVCRLNHVAPGHMHKACFHPVSVIGTLGAAAGAGTALGLEPRQMAMAFGIAGSMSSGIIEYLTDGAWTNGSIQAGRRSRGCAPQ